MTSSDPVKPDAALECRLLKSREDYRAGLQLQEATWGVGFAERVPPMLMMVANEMGGLAAGAFDASGAMLGFIFGISGLRRSRLAHWSDMCAVAESARDRGIGRQLKLFQREVMLSRGIEVVHWSFDPLVARNAWFNVARLGAEPDEYVTDMYPDSDSPLHTALGTDRFIVRWELRPEPPALLKEAPPARFEAPDFRLGSSESSLPAEFPPRFCVPIPPDAFALAKEDPGAARALRAETRAIFRAALSGGWRVRGFDQTRRYLLEKESL
jgi:predicted GNAT superfamily acetyltransferase